MKHLALPRLLIPALLIIPAGASGHDTWFIPDRFVVAAAEAVVFDLTSGMEFPKNDSAIKQERLEVARCRLAGSTTEISGIEAGPQSLRLKQQVEKAGLATCWVQLLPRALELKPAEVEEYLEEVGAPDSIRKAWAEMKPQRWRESYRKGAKTVLRVGEAENDVSWKEPVGMPLEIVPERDPTRVKVHATELFTVTVLKDGAPLADFSLNAIRAGDKEGETRKTNAGGAVSFRLAQPGRWLIRGTELRRSQKPDVDWESDFSTLTLEVSPK